MLARIWMLRFHLVEGRARPAMLALYYLAIISGLILLYGKGDFSTPGFIYQEF